MHCLSRNKQTCYYATCTGKTEITDSYGNYTGETRPTYGTATAIELNIAHSSGNILSMPYGLEDVYTLKAVTADLSCPISEDSILWVGVPTTSAHNYRVLMVAKGLDSIVYYLKGVDA